MQELLTAWQNGMFLPKFIITVVGTSPLWAGIIAYCYHRYMMRDDVDEIIKRQRW